MRKRKVDRTILGGLMALMLATSSAVFAAEAPMPDLGPDFRTACWIGDLERVTTLLQQGAPLEGRDNLGRTPLMLAAHGEPDIIKLLLAHGARLDAMENDGDIPLSNAAEHGGLAGVQVLVAAGSDLNHVNRYGQTPLDLAARGGRDDVVGYLLAQHANLTGGDPKSPALSFAVWQDHLSTARLLLAAGAQVPVPASVKSAGGKWGTMMMVAADTGDPAMIDLLLDHGGDINEQDDGDRSAFTVVVEHSKDAALISHLLDRGANPNSADHLGATPFTMAESWSSPEVVKLLVARGANVNAQDIEGKSELMIMAGFNNPVKEQALLAFHPDVNLQDKTGETALTLAGDRGGVEVMQLLRQAGAQDRPIHIILKPYHENLSQAQAWALAVGALYGQYNGYSHDSLPQDPNGKGPIAKSLAHTWNIRNHDDLLTRIRELEEVRTAGSIGAGEAVDFVDEGLQRGWWDAVSHAGSMAGLDVKWRGKLNVAWDACREANLVCEGVTAGYIGEAEAWPILLRNARRVQGAYGSWREMNESFLDSREILAGEIDPDFRACADLLLNAKDPNSPWNELPWDTDLGK
jgi:ankyrin repeat protein